MKFLRLFFIALCFSSPFSTYADAPIFQQPETEELIITNRILAKVNTKTISVIDVMKKMDMFLQKNYPQYINSTVARYQFYSSQWKEYLTQMIDQELMLADAEHLELKVTDADVREEVLQRFGPNMMLTLDTMGLTYDEMRKMVHEEMIVQRMVWLRVNSKALNRINSQDVKLAYQNYCEENPALQEWQYKVLSIRSANQQTSELLANKAVELLESKIELSTLADQLKSYCTNEGDEKTAVVRNADDKSLSIHVSPELQADEKSISEMHRQVLKTLTENTYSLPIQQVSRADQSIVYRIFHLIKHSTKSIPDFENIAEQLKDELLQEAANSENAQYIVKLRKRLGYDEKQMLETLPHDFQPFILR